MAQRRSASHARRLRAVGTATYGAYIMRSGARGVLLSNGDGVQSSVPGRPPGAVPAELAPRLASPTTPPTCRHRDWRTARSYAIVPKLGPRHR